MSGVTGPGGLPYRDCAGVVLMNGDGLVFAGQRIDTPGAWQMPQGGIDKGETPREAALRELEEEIGVRADLVGVVAETPDWVRSTCRRNCWARSGRANMADSGRNGICCALPGRTPISGSIPRILNLIAGAGCGRMT